MKHKMAAAMLAASILFTLTACGGPAAESTPPTVSPTLVTQAPETNSPTPAEPPETLEPTASNAPATTESKTLVVYFSRVGVTPFDDGVDASSSVSINIRDGELVGNMQYLAEFIAEETGGDLFQIITEKEYPVEYRATTDLAAVEQEDDERPALTSHVENMDQYDVIFLG